MTIASHPVYTCRVDAKIINIITTMKNKLYTHVPVYDENDEFVGLFSETAVMYWVASQAESDGFLITQDSVGEMEKFIRKDPNNEYCFMARDASVYEAEDLFHTHINKGKRLGVILSTQNGKKEEKLLGIVTAWDLPKIKR